MLKASLTSFAGLFLGATLAFADVTVKTASDSGGDNPIAAGEALYLCNVGISHPRLAAPIKKDCSESEDCKNEVIYDPTKGSDHLLVDSYRTVMASPSRTSLASNVEQWSTTIRDLNVNLGSETYGATYNLDFCYRGPLPYFKADKKKGCGKGQIEEDGYCYGETTGNSGNGNGNGNDPKKAVDLSQGIYNLNLFLSGASPKYIQNSKLYARTQYVCSYRAAGKSRGSDVGDFSLNLNSSSGIYMPFGSQQMMSAQLNTTEKNIPRFCLIRFEFKEFSNEVRQYLVDHAEISVGLDIVKQSAVEEESEGDKIP